MKSNNVFTRFLLGLLISVAYFCAIITLYYAAGVLHIFPVFAGEDDFSVRRMIVLFVFTPSVFVFGYFLGDRKKCKSSIIGMLFSSVFYGVLAFFLKDYFLGINDRDMANWGVFVYFFTFMLVNLFGLYLSRKVLVNI